MKPSALLCSVLLAAVLAWPAAHPASAQRFPRELENIKVYGKGETVEFVFSRPYQGTPAQDYGKGAFSLNFSGTGSTKPVRALRPVEESIYREIKVVQNRYSTTTTFVLKDAALSLKDRLAFASEDNVLRLQVQLPPALAPASAEGREAQKLLREMEQRIGGPEARNAVPAAAQGGGAEGGGGMEFGQLAGGDFFSSLVSMVVALVVIVGALYGVLYLYNRFFATRLGRFTSSHAIRQVASFHIGPRQRVVVLDINGELIACGVTPNQISYLTHLGGKGPVARQAAAAAAEGLAAQRRDEDAPAPGGGTQAAPALAADAARDDPVHQFAEVLKQKVRSLKRIN